ncbi:MAG: DUF4845 domain-containing protein [Woeseiaceae bacterium]|nr:DUF4845 domain-containing protein [Woeseiaceae bacterium]
MNSETKYLSLGAGRGARPGRGPRLTGRTMIRQAGITTVGFLILGAFLSLFAFAAIRLTPVYLNHMKVAGVLNGVYEEFDGQNPSRAAIRTSISRRFEVESVTQITHREVKVTPDNAGFLVQAAYEYTTPFIANIYFTVKFDKQVLIRR